MIKIGDRWVDPEQVAVVEPRLADENGEVPDGCFVTLKTTIHDPDAPWDGAGTVNDGWVSSEDPRFLAHRINKALSESGARR